MKAKTDISVMYGQIDKSKPPAIASAMFVLRFPRHDEYCTFAVKYLGDGHTVSMVATVRAGHAADPWAAAVESASLSAQMATTWAKHRAELDALFVSIRAANVITDEHRAAFARLWEVP